MTLYKDNLTSATTTSTAATAAHTTSPTAAVTSTTSSWGEGCHFLVESWEPSP